MPLQAYTRAGNAELPVIFALAFWFVLEFVRGLLQAGGFGADVAYVAHVSGFALGCSTAVVVGSIQRKGGSSPSRGGPPRTCGKGEAYAAQGDYLEYLAHRPADATRTRGSPGRWPRRATAPAPASTTERPASGSWTANGGGSAEAIYQEAVRGIDDFALERRVSARDGVRSRARPQTQAGRPRLRDVRREVPGPPGIRRSPFCGRRASTLNVFSDPATADSLYGRFLVSFPGDTWADFAKEQRRKLACQMG